MLQSPLHVHVPSNPISIGLKDTNSQSAIELLMSQPTLLENLRKAHQGNYGIILSLLGCLDHGLRAKKLVDKVIDTGVYSRSTKEASSFTPSCHSRSSDEFTRRNFNI